MNAVNLIPAGSRKRGAPLTTSRPTLALIGGLVIVLVAAVLYVTAANKVNTRQAELTQVTASAARWSAVAGSYQQFVQAAQQRSQELADVRQLAAGRYPWEQLLSQVAGLLPATAGLTSLQATTTPAGGSSATSGAGSSATSSGSTSSTIPATSTAAAPLPSVQLSGCAASQSSVAQTMVQLHRIEGVTAVTLSSASESGTGGAASGASSGATGQAGGGGCPFPVQFQVSLTFAAPAATGTTSQGSAATGTGANSAPATHATTGSGGTPTGSAATSSTGAPAQ